jgi:predicted dehydrogenase
VDRREFVAAAASAAMAQAQTKEPLGIAFLGVSHSHGEAKLALVRESADWRLVGVAEQDAALRDKLANQKVPLLSREQLLSHPEVRVVAVESAVRDHAADGIAVLRSGKHLHLEKAPAASLRDFESIVKLAQEKNLLLQTGYMWRYHPGVEKIVEAARSGWLGKIYLLRATIGNQLEGSRRPEWAEFAGGVMFELGGHVIDPLVRIMGRPAKITPFLHRDGDFQDNLKDNTAAVFEWPGAMALVQSTTLQPGSSRYRSIEVHGTNGTAVLQPIEPPELAINLAAAAGPYIRGIQKVPLPAYRRYVDDFAELAAAVRGEKKLRVTLEEELNVQAALLRASGMA